MGRKCIKLSAMKILPSGIAVLEEDTHISKWVEESGRLDHDEYALPIILEFIKEGDHVVDAGAFIGDHTIAYLKAVGESGKVVAIEPNPQAYECLCHNCQDALCLNLAIGDKEESLDFSISSNVGASHLSSENGSVIVVTLDSLLFPKLDFLKIDVEGFELKALQGAKKTIAHYLPTMWIEINSTALSRQGCRPADVIRWVIDMGYEVEPFPDEGGDQYDILCLPPSSTL